MVATASVPTAYQSPELEPDLLELLAERLRAERGFDLLSFKPGLLKRRLAVRVRARSCAGLSSYLKVLESDPGEVDALIRALTIQVSGFFRSPQTYWLLRDRVFPGLLERRGEPAGLLLVSAGCAQGEEPYSLSILVRHYFGKRAHQRVRVAGFDIDAGVLEKARAARYGARQLKGLPPDLADLYFLKRGNEYILRDEIKSGVEFFSGDLREGLPLSNVDLIMCRNLLIYFRREHQGKILKSLMDRLSPGGYLVLGKTETMLGQLRSGFSVVDVSERIYRKAGE